MNVQTNQHQVLKRISSILIDERISLVVQWLRLLVPRAGGPVSVPFQELDPVQQDKNHHPIIKNKNSKIKQKILVIFYLLLKTEV